MVAARVPGPRSRWRWASAVCLGLCLPESVAARGLHLNVGPANTRRALPGFCLAPGCAVRRIRCVARGYERGWARGTHATPRRWSRLHSSAVEDLDPSRMLDGVDGAPLAEEKGDGAKPPPVPSLWALLSFTLPTLGIWLSSPILSLVDTSVVGLQSSVELAAMGPATNVCDTFLYVFTFLAVATTNLLSQALAEGDDEKSRTVVSHAIAIALAAGCFVTGFIELFGKQMLVSTIGQDAGLLVPYALKYTSIRALGAPAVLVSMVAQAALLGRKDSVTPLVVTITSTVVNLVGDVLLVTFLGQGIGGAAWATILAEFAGTAVLLRALKEVQGPSKQPFVSTPNFGEMTTFCKFAGPIFFALVGKSIIYSALGFRAQVFGAIPLAAHQVLMKIFFLFTCFGDSLSTTSQAFLPGLLVTKNKKAVSAIIRRVLFLSLLMGGVNAVASGLIPFHFSQLFTTDADIVRQMQNLAPYLSISLLVHACTMALEGVLLAERELSFLASSYAFNTVLIVAGLFVMSWLGYGSLTGVWVWLVFFQLSRLLQFGVKVMQNYGQMDRITQRVREVKTWAKSDPRLKKFKRFL